MDDYVIIGKRVRFEVSAAAGTYLRMVPLQADGMSPIVSFHVKCAQGPSPGGSPTLQF